MVLDPFQRLKQWLGLALDEVSEKYQVPFRLFLYPNFLSARQRAQASGYSRGLGQWRPFASFRQRAGLNSDSKSFPGTLNRAELLSLYFLVLLLRHRRIPRAVSHCEARWRGGEDYMPEIQNRFFACECRPARHRKVLTHPYCREDTLRLLAYPSIQ